MFESVYYKNSRNLNLDFSLRYLGSVQVISLISIRCYSMIDIKYIKCN